MNLISWIVLGLMALWALIALVYVIRHRGSYGTSCESGCNGDCAHCTRHMRRNAP